VADGRLAPRARRGGADGFGRLTGPAPAGEGAADGGCGGAADADCRSPAAVNPGPAPGLVVFWAGASVWPAAAEVGLAGGREATDPGTAGIGWVLITFGR
jgi:hypothetical protein